MDSAERSSVADPSGLPEEHQENGSQSSQQTNRGEETIDRGHLEKTMQGIWGQSKADGLPGEHHGVVFKDLTVKGVGLGASFAPSVGLILSLLAWPPNLIRTIREKKHPPVRTLIHAFQGCVREGEMLLVLGRPGSGCTTFLKAIANERDGFHSVQGHVTYAGLSAQAVAQRYRHEVAYNEENDVHFPTLTVQQTLDIAIKTRVPADQANRQPGETRKDYLTRFRSVLAELFGLKHALGTKVGNELVRGISGGEKKRVSIAETLVTRAAITCWDNSTRGLDSSTALEYIQSLRAMTNMTSGATLVTIYQAGEALYDLFDKVLVIDEGRCVYFGPAGEMAVKYFEGLGYYRAPRQTHADFLSSITDAVARRVRKGWESRTPRTPIELEQAYLASEVSKQNSEEIQAYEALVAANLSSDQLEQDEKKKKSTRKRKIFNLPFYKQVTALVVRQYQVTGGDPFTLVAKNGAVIFQSIIIGTLFFRLDPTTSHAFNYGGVMFFALLFNALLSLAELSAAFFSRPIIYKHDRFAFYRPSAHALAQIVADLPVIGVQVVIFSLIIYFMTGLAETASQFFIFIMFLYVLVLTMYGYFRMLAAWSASLDVATIFAGLSIQILVVYAGYIIPYQSMHPWFIWLYWINPLAYGFEGLMSNQFYNLPLLCTTLVPSGPTYTNIANQGCTLVGSAPGQAFVAGASYIQTQFGYTRSHLWRNLAAMIGFWLLFTLMTVIGVEVKRFGRGNASVTLYKRGSVPTSLEKTLEKDAANDSEAGSQDDRTSSPLPPPTEKITATGAGTNTAKISKTPHVFSWQHVDYTLTTKGQQRKLLDDVQGWAKPGCLTALMGESGAGKTTLLNALAQRIQTGVVTGELFLDGRVIPDTFVRRTGYVEQMDLHEPTASVREALQFSALLRQSRHIPIEEKYAYCEEVITLLEMESFADAIIGRSGNSLSVEQRKRVTIAVELAARPEILLFLDEPTSGLDGQAAYNIVRFLRKLTASGMAILCTIHQPSAELFLMFDELLLLGKGGQTLYQGELGKDSQTIISYFESHGAKKCPSSANPAEYMLEVVGAGAAAVVHDDWNHIWRQSQERQAITEECDRLRTVLGAQPAASISDENNEYASPIFLQIKAMLKRTLVSYWRSPEYIRGKVMLHITTGLFNGFTFFKIKDNVQGLQNRLFTCFLVLTIAPPLINQLQPRYLAARNLLETREGPTKTYHWIAFVISAIAAELPYSLVLGVIYWCCWYYTVGFPKESSRAGYTLLMFLVFEVYYPSFGQAIAAFAPNPFAASILVPVFFPFLVAFCGVLAPPTTIPHFWRSWMYPLTPFHYLLEGFVINGIQGLQVTCSTEEFTQFIPPVGQTCGQYAGDFLSTAGGYLLSPNATDLCDYCQYSLGEQYGARLLLSFDHRYRDFGILIGYVVFDWFLIAALHWVFRERGPLKMLRRRKRSVH